MAIEKRFNELWREKERKENRRITLTEVSDQSGVGWGTVNRWKRNDVTRFDDDVLSKLCSYFGCKTGDLLVFVSGSENDTTN